MAKERYVVVDSETGETRPLSDILAELAQAIGAEFVQLEDQQYIRPGFFKRIVAKGKDGTEN